jgi:YidC/Oxa1 family membrane protein insertase
MFASIFDVVIVKPIFNLLVAIYDILPGHNFGLALIIFTVVVRLLMWPLVKKQLHQARAMKKLQPEIKKIKIAAKGNRQEESKLLMELYKERDISPFGSIGTLIVQFIVLIGLYIGLRKVVNQPEYIITGSYSWLANLAWMKQLAGNIHLFDATLLHTVNLTRSAIKSGQGVYWPAMIIVLASAITQYYSSKQLLPNDKEARSLKNILKDAGTGAKADQTEVSAAVGRSTKFLIPVMIFIVGVDLPAALSLYWFVGGLIAFLQQGYILRQDEEEMEVIGNKTTKKPTKSKSNRPVVKAEVISKKPINKSEGIKITKKGSK